MTSVLELAKLTQKIVPVLILERKRLEFALARHDKDGMREIHKSLVHLYFDLADLNELLPEISGEPVESCRWDYEEWFYPEHETMPEEEVHKKLVEFYLLLSRARKAINDLICGIMHISPNKFLSHLAGHIFLTSILLKLDIERMTGAELSG